MALLLVLLAWCSAFAGTLTVDILDVGQGDSILLRSPAGKAVLIDAGEGKARVSDQLRALGVTELSMAVASHPHADHIGGMNDVLLAIPTKLYVDNGLTHTTATYNTLMRTVELRGIPYKAALAGQTYNLDDGIKLEVLAPVAPPLRGTRSDLNANSVVLRLTHGKDCMLLMGDSEAESEDGLVHRGLQPCEVLKVAHHGSEYSSTQPFLDAAKPKIALISAGADNSYGHPGPKTMARLEAMGVTIYRTDTMGGIRLSSDGKGWKVQTGVSAVAQATPAPAIQGAEIPSTPPAATATSSADDSSAPAPDPSCPYVASRNSTLFHSSTCDTGRRISPATRVCYATREDAAAAGRTPARDCTP